MLRRVLLAVLLLGLLAPVSADAVAPLRTPSFRVALLTKDPVVALRGGALKARITAKQTASVRLSAAARQGGRRIALGPARTFRFRARRRSTRSFALRLTPQGRRAISSCTTARIELRIRARGFGSPPLRTRRATKTRDRTVSFACRGGVIVPAPATSPAAEPGPSVRYEVGAAQRSIAPGSDGRFGGEKVFLGGYGLGGDSLVQKGRAATGILGAGPSVRAFVVSDGTRTWAVADLEVQGWFAATREPGLGLIDLRRRVAQRLGGAVSPENILVQSDHSHSGADAMGVWGGVPTAFRRFMLDQAEDAIVDAFVNRRPGRLFYGAVDGADLLSNQFSYDAANGNDVVDGEVRLLQARDAAGKPFATLLNFSAHTTVLGADNTKISGDWVQAVNPLLEQRFGGRATTMIGTFGRTQPKERADAACPKEGDSKQLCKIDAYARRIVDLAGDAAARATPLGGPPRVDSRSYLITDVATNAIIVGLEVPGQVAGIPFNRSLSPPWQTGTVLGTVTSSARIGDVVISGGPGEMYPQIPLGVRSLLERSGAGVRGFMTAGLAGDQLGYLIAPYEAYPEPIRRSFMTQEGVTGDQLGVSPIDNDNYFFNVSQTLGERVTCSLLRGAGDLFGRGTTLRDAAPRCALFANDAALSSGADGRGGP